jgi:hypothetical protein
MSQRRYPGGHSLRDYRSNETKTFSTNKAVDLEQRDVTDPDASEINGRLGANHEMEDTDEESDEDIDDDLSLCSDGDNYKANTKALINRIEGRWQR